MLDHSGICHTKIFYYNVLMLISLFRLIFVNGECCQDWLKRLSQSLNLPRKPEEVFSLAFYAWTRDDDENHLTKPPVNQTMPWWRNLSNYDQPLTGEKLFRFEVSILGIYFNLFLSGWIHTNSIIRFFVCLFFVFVLFCFCRLNVKAMMIP